MHGVVGRRPSPRLRIGHRSRQLRRPRPGRPDRAGRLERRLVPSGSVPAHDAEPPRARRQARRHRSTPDRHRRGRRPLSARRAGHGHALFCGLLVHLSTIRRFRPDLCRYAYQWLRRGARACEGNRTGYRCDRRCMRPREKDVARFFDLFTATGNTVTCFSQGVNQSAQGTDKVNAIINCHLATGRIGKPGHGAFLAHRTAECDGRPRGRRPRQPARRAYGILAGGGRSRAPLLERTAHGRARRPQGRANVRSDRTGKNQSALGDGNQSGGIVAARRGDARSAQETRALCGLRERAARTTP